MKQLLTFVLVGGVVSGLAGSVLLGLYWFAPIVPCEVEEATTGYVYAPLRGRHEDTCTGQVLHSWEYPRRHHPLRSARLLQAGLVLSSLFAGVLGGASASSVVSRKRPRAAQP